MRPQPHRLRLHAPPLRASVSSCSLEDVAQRQYRDRVERAREEGRAQGLAEAVASAASLLEHAAERLEQERGRLHEEVAQGATHLIVAIARRVLRRELEAGRYDIEAITREALARSGAGREGCVVHLSPADHQALRDVPFRAGTRLEADATLGPGDVHVTTRQGVLLREVDEILAALPDELLGRDA